jgi:hypothetical protein
LFSEESGPEAFERRMVMEHKKLQANIRNANVARIVEDIGSLP